MRVIVSWRVPAPMHNGIQVTSRVGVNSGIEWELNSIPDLIPGIGLGIGIENKRNWN